MRYYSIKAKPFLMAIFIACLSFCVTLNARPAPPEIKDNPLDNKYYQLLEPLTGKHIEIELVNQQSVAGKLVETGNQYLCIDADGRISRISYEEIAKLDYEGWKKKQKNPGHRILKGMGWAAWGALVFVETAVLLLVVGSAYER